MATRIITLVRTPAVLPQHNICKTESARVLKLRRQRACLQFPARPAEAVMQSKIPVAVQSSLLQGRINHLAVDLAEQLEPSERTLLVDLMREVVAEREFAGNTLRLVREAIKGLNV